VSSACADAGNYGECLSKAKGGERCIWELIWKYGTAFVEACVECGLYRECEEYETKEFCELDPCKPEDGRGDKKCYWIERNEQCLELTADDWRCERFYDPEDPDPQKCIGENCLPKYRRTGLLGREEYVACVSCFEHDVKCSEYKKDFICEADPCKPPSRPGRKCKWVKRKGLFGADWLVKDVCEDVSCFTMRSKRWRDEDEDCIPDRYDNCPAEYNPEQEDSDYDCVGDVCDDDADNDGLKNEEEDLNGNRKWDKGDEPTDWRKCDTDGDGIPDGIELSFREIYDAFYKIGGFMAIFYFAYLGVRFVMADDPRERAGIKSGFLHILIGLIILMMSEDLVGYLLAGAVSNSCGIDSTRSCEQGSTTKILSPENQLNPEEFASLDMEAFGTLEFGHVGRRFYLEDAPVLFVAQTRTGAKVKSYKWIDEAICVGEGTGTKEIGSTSHFIKNDLCVGVHNITLEVNYEGNKLMPWKNNIEKDSVIIGISKR